MYNQTLRVSSILLLRYPLNARFAKACHLRLLILIMIIHLIIPEHRLIPIPPEEVLRPDVLVRILDSFLQRREMAPVLPVLHPEVVGVDGAED